MRRFLMSILALLVLAYLGFCAFLWWNQERLLFFPTREPAAQLEQIARSEGYEPWTSANGERIGWKSTNAAADALLVFHGNGGYALHRNYEAFRTTGQPVQIYLLEYPGYGSRIGLPTEKTLTDAAVEAIDSVPGEQRLLIFGQSLGTGVACAAIARRPERAAGLALLTPFDSLVSAARHHYPWLPVSWLIRHRFESGKNLAGYHGPVAFIVAERDGTVPAKLGENLYENYAGPKKLWLVRGANHNDIHDLLADWPQILRWLSSPQ